MIQRVVAFVGCSALIWGLLVVPAWLLWGNEQLLQSLAAFGLVLVPAAVTLIWVSWTYRKAPDMRLLAALGSSGLRMAVALGGGIGLMLGFPQSFDVPFWIWLVVLYLSVLGLEIVVLLRADSTSTREC
jgi:hypothetical protein